MIYDFMVASNCYKGKLLLRPQYLASKKIIKVLLLVLHLLTLKILIDHWSLTLTHNCMYHKPSNKPKKNFKYDPIKIHFDSMSCLHNCNFLKDSFRDTSHKKCSCTLCVGHVEKCFWATRLSTSSPTYVCKFPGMWKSSIHSFSHLFIPLFKRRRSKSNIKQKIPVLLCFQYHSDHACTKFMT